VESSGRNTMFTEIQVHNKTNKRRMIVSFTLPKLKSWMKKLKELYQEQNKKLLKSKNLKNKQKTFTLLKKEKEKMQERLSASYLKSKLLEKQREET